MSVLLIATCARTSHDRSPLFLDPTEVRLLVNSRAYIALSRLGRDVLDLLDLHTCISTCSDIQVPGWILTSEDGVGIYSCPSTGRLDALNFGGLTRLSLVGDCFRSL